MIIREEINMKKIMFAFLFLSSLAVYAEDTTITTTETVQVEYQEIDTDGTKAVERQTFIDRQEVKAFSVFVFILGAYFIIAQSVNSMLDKPIIP